MLVLRREVVVVQSKLRSRIAKTKVPRLQYFVCLLCLWPPTDLTPRNDLIAMCRLFGVNTSPYSQGKVAETGWGPKACVSISSVFNSLWVLNGYEPLFSIFEVVEVDSVPQPFLHRASPYKSTEVLTRRRPPDWWSCDAVIPQLRVPLVRGIYTSYARYQTIQCIYSYTQYRCIIPYI